VRGIGIDIVEVKRFKRLGSRFLEKVFTAEEIKYCLKSAAPAMHFAARFAAKEAVIKATRKKNIALRDIFVRNRSGGAPEVFVKGKKKKFYVSISHTDSLAVAVVVSV